MSSEFGYRERRSRLLRWMIEKGVDLVALEDVEGRRNAGLPYLTGMPEDALVFLAKSGKTYLIPWDELLASDLGFADEIIPYNSFKRRFKPALEDVIRREGLKNPLVEISAATPYPVYLSLSEGFAGSILCRSEGVDEELNRLRKIKSPEEIACLRKACSITNTIIDELEQKLSSGGLTSGGLTSEMDVAFFIDKRARSLGAAGPSFDTIAAGPSRSFCLHAHPGFTAGPFAAHGLSLVDFGVRYDQAATDVTLTCVFGPPTDKARAMIEAVEGAYGLAMKLIKPGVNGYEVARQVDEFIESRGYSMPHALGHGIGLEVHESPVFRNREDSAFIVEQGMVVAIEPGVYDKDLGGVRLENDILVTAAGVEILTTSRILFLPHPEI